MSKWASGLSGSCSPNAGSLVHAAAKDLEHICEWIERDSPAAARRVARTIYYECARLKDFPYIGRPSRRMAGRRELVFAPLPYIVVYQVKADAVRFRASSTERRTGLDSASVK